MLNFILSSEKATISPVAKIEIEAGGGVAYLTSIGYAGVLPPTDNALAPPDNSRFPPISTPVEIAAEPITFKAEPSNVKFTSELIVEESTEVMTLLSEAFV
jgi:hypothetical protein